MSNQTELTIFINMLKRVAVTYTVTQDYHNEITIITTYKPQICTEYHFDNNGELVEII